MLVSPCGESVGRSDAGESWMGPMLVSRGYVRCWWVVGWSDAGESLGPMLVSRGGWVRCWWVRAGESWGPMLVSQMRGCVKCWWVSGGWVWCRCVDWWRKAVEPNPIRRWYLPTSWCIEVETEKDVNFVCQRGKNCWTVRRSDDAPFAAGWDVAAFGGGGGATLQSCRVASNPRLMLFCLSTIILSKILKSRIGSTKTTTTTLVMTNDDEGEAEDV